MNIIKHRKIYFTVSILMAIASLAVLVFWGLKFSIDFTGGALIEIEFQANRPGADDIRLLLSDLNLGQINIQLAGDKEAILRLKDIDEKTHQEILKRLNSFGLVEEKRFESVGPLIGNELKRKTFWAIGLSLVGLIIYIAWTFRKVSRPVASWKYGLVAVLVLFHDIFVTVGVFSVLGHFKGAEIDLPFIAAILTILGYSVNNIIVVFDRTRENLLRTLWKDFEEVVNNSVNQSIVRCINTSLTVVLTLLTIFFFGGETIRYFALALIVGVFIGTYSAIFITSSVIVAWHKKSQSALTNNR